MSNETMNSAIQRELDRLNHAPIAWGETGCALFEADERVLLKRLPRIPWEWGEWIERKVGPNCHAKTALRTLLRSQPSSDELPALQEELQVLSEDLGPDAHPDDVRHRLEAQERLDDRLHDLVLGLGDPPDQGPSTTTPLDQTLATAEAGSDYLETITGR